MGCMDGIVDREEGGGGGDGRWNDHRTWEKKKSRRNEGMKEKDEM